MRLDKLLSDMQGITRSEIKRLIKQGTVTVDGVKCASPKQQVDPKIQSVCLLGEEIQYQKFVYYMFNKPGNCVTARQDALHKTVMDYITDKRKGLSPVGRLDLNSEGLLLMTNDGALAQRMTHPSHEVSKTYHVSVSGMAERAAERLSAMRDLEGETIRPAQVSVLRRSGETAELSVTIHEGKNRQVRRMCAACGLEVKRLRRVREHTLTLGSLPPGKWRHLTAAELEALRSSR